MAKKEEPEKEDNAERWLLTYSDMITLLLALFIMLYAMSNIDAEKFKALAEQLGSTLGGHSIGDNGGGGAGTGAGGLISSGDESSSPDSSSSSSVSSGGEPLTDEFAELYELLKKDIEDRGYEDKIIIDKGDTYIHFRFKDSVLFFPDSTRIRPEGFDVLKYIGDAMYRVSYLIDSVRIEGHTADDGNKQQFFGWELSSGRALAVLEYMVDESKLPENLMSTAAYSSYVPIADNSTEDGRALNRRVEITITRVATGSEGTPPEAAGSEAPPAVPESAVSSSAPVSP